MTRIFMLCSVLSLQGCAPIIGLVGDTAYSAILRIKIEDASTLSADEYARVKAIELHDSPEGLQRVSKGFVAGLCCKAGVLRWSPRLSALNGETPEESAMMQLKIRAMQNGANAILNPKCSYSDGIDWRNNCWESWVCVGEAIRIER